MHNQSLPPSDRDDSSVLLSTSSIDSADSNAVAGMQEARQRVPGDIVNKATAALPDNQRSAIRRFHAYYIEQGLTIEEAAKLLKLAGSTLSFVFHGKYPAKLDNIVASINGFFRVEDKRNQSRKLEFIVTRLSRRIWGVCDTSLEFQRIGFIFGDQQIGKSEALKAYQVAHNHGSTIYVEVPTGGCLLDFLCSLAEKLRISPSQRVSLLRRRIINAFDDRMLLIVDEIHRTVDDQASKHSVRTIEFIRELFNARACGIVVCGTNVFRDEMESGDLEKILRQFKRRRLCCLQLDNKPTREDLNTFAAAHGLPPSEGESRALENDLIEREALGMWLLLLRMAAKIAHQASAKLTWAHVLSAHAGLQDLEGKLK